MKLTTKILIGILVALFLVNGIWIARDIRNEIKLNQELVQKQLKVNDQIILDIYKQLNTNNKIISIINQNLEMLNKSDERTLEIEKLLSIKIDNLPQKIQIDKTNIEYKLRQSVVLIYNKTSSALGSGVTIKYKDKFYILSAGHMAEADTDILTFGENDRELGELEIIKHEFVIDEDEKGDFTKTKDLILLQPKNKSLRPKFYVELADNESLPPTEIYIIGNPVGIEDVLSEGRIIKYKNNFVYYINHTYYGNSGGGVFTEDGKLLGIVSHMYPINYNQSIPAYMTYGATRLDIIKDFLKDVN